MDSFPDLGSLSDPELKELIEKFTEEEEQVSYKRRILHGKIDILRAELVNRLRKKREEGEAVITRRRRAAADGHPRRARRPPQGPSHPTHGSEQSDALPRVRLHQQPGRELLPEVRRAPGRRAAGGDQTTITYKVDETGDFRPVDLEEVVPRGWRTGRAHRRRARG